MTVGMVIPTLATRPSLLAEAVSTIKAQDGVDVELVIVTSPRSQPEVESEYPDVRVIAQSGSGIVDAIEEGWLALSPEIPYVAWLGDDDRLVSGSLLAGTRALSARPKAGMVFGRCRYITYDGAALREIRPGRLAVPLLRMGTNLIAQPGAIYRRSAIRAIGGLDPDLELAFDIDLHLRLAKDAGAVYVPRVLGEARVHPTSLTTSQRGRSQAELERATTCDLWSVAVLTRPVWHPAARLAGRVAYKVSSRVAS